MVTDDWVVFLAQSFFFCIVKPDFLNINEAILPPGFMNIPIGLNPTPVSFPTLPGIYVCIATC